MAIRNNDYILLNKGGGDSTPPVEDICFMLEDGSGLFEQEQDPFCFLTEESNPPPSGSALLLQDGSSFLLLTDGSSKLLLSN